MFRRTFPAAIALILTGCVAAPDLEARIARAQVAQTTMVVAADGSTIAELHGEIDRRVVPLSEIPPLVRKAVIAVEDERFYQHTGIDWEAIARAAVSDASKGKVVEGGSTITQQLVKNILVEPERTLKRKIHEAVLASALEKRWSKGQILERYMNTVYFGRGAYGIEAAARAYYSKRARDLSLADGALLAGLIREPSSLDPVAEPRDAIARRAAVLKRMRTLEMISAVTERNAARGGLGLKPTSDERYDAPYFVEHVKRLIFDDAVTFRALGETRGERINAVFRGGLRIETSLDPRLQRVAEIVARSTLRSERDPATAFVAIDPHDGGIRAMVGGRDFFDPDDPHAKFNLATQARRQPGSAFKPFALVAALEQGIPLDARYRAGSSITLQVPGGGSWRVRNYEGGSFGGSMSLRRATALSVNVVYAQVALQVGAGRIADVAERMGITSRLRAYPSIALGAQEVSPLELARAYATLANGGYRVEPAAIKKITDANGRVLFTARQRKTRVIDASVAAQAVSALQDVLRSGTAANRRVPFTAAAKTGTSEEYADAWFAGFTPRMVAVSWVGFPRAQISMRPPRTRIVVYGSSWPGQMWRAFMMQAERGLPPIEFPAAAGTLEQVRFDVLRGCIANEFTPSFLIQERTFARGEEPPRCTQPLSADARVPNVRGRSQEVAERMLALAGLDARVGRRYCPSHPEGLVCEQEPAPGSTARQGDLARIWVSDDSLVEEVPMVLGMSVSRARSTLEKSGFEVVVKTRANDQTYTGCRDGSVRDAGSVWSQDPCAGATYERGGTITLLANP